MEKEEDTTLYETLGINPSQVDVLSVSDKDLTTAYRRTALKWHPDKNRNNPIAASHFSRVVDAYETLSAPAKRKEYDDRIRKARARKETLQNMDQTRRRLRQQLHEREQRAAVAAAKGDGGGSGGGYGGSATAGKSSQQSRRDALSRVQTEIDRVRKQREQQQHQQQHQEQQQKQEQQQQLDRQQQRTGTASYAAKGAYAQDAAPSQREETKRSVDTKAHKDNESAFWSTVPNFSQFKAKVAPVSFEQFEKDILQGRSPFI